MIISDQMSPDAVDYLNEIEAQKSANETDMAKITAEQELLSFCNGWFNRANQWRRSSYESKWLLYQRNSDSLFDPSLRAKKEPWQSTAFWDMTATHRESIQGSLYKLLFGSDPIIEVSPRYYGDQSQAENLRDITLREFDKSGLKTQANLVLEDATTYGSGFCRITWEEKYQDRLVRESVFEPVDPSNPQSMMLHASGQAPLIGFRESIQPQLVYRGVKMQHIPIWDFFPDPKALEIEDSPCAFRFRQTYQEILDGVAQGYYLKSAAQKLKNVTPNETEPEGKLAADNYREISQEVPQRTQNDKRFELKEYYALLPQKWVFPILNQPQPVTDPDRLIPARVVFHDAAICAVELNSDYEGHAPYYKLDYFKVAGRFYARGIPEMLKDKQAITNEVINQRLDNGALVLNKGIIVVEKALVDSRDLTSKPGMAIRINNKALGPNGDVKNVIQTFDMGSLNLQSGFSEVYEQERSAAERTGANRTTLGTAGLVKDSNMTLGGQELAKQAASEKLAYIGMVMEYSWFNKIIWAYWKNIYANVQPEDIFNAIGPERAAGFKLMSPIELDQAYKFVPQGIFEMMNKGRLQVQLQSIYQQFAMSPELDPMKIFDILAKNIGLDPQSLKRTPEEMYQFLVGQGLMSTPHPKAGPMPPKDAPKEQNNETAGNV